MARICYLYVALHIGMQGVIVCYTQQCVYPFPHELHLKRIKQCAVSNTANTNHLLKMFKCVV
jgi:hypothetical protein